MKDTHKARLKLIKGNADIYKKAEEKKEDLRNQLWVGTFFEHMADATDSMAAGCMDRDAVAKAAYAGVRSFCIDHNGIYVAEKFLLGKEHDAMETLRTAFSIHNSIIDLFSKMTPNEIIRLFPPAKEYDGEKYGAKDWYTAMDAVKKAGSDKPIGDDVKTVEFLGDTNNMFLRIFCVAGFLLVDGLRRAEGQEGMLEEFFRKQTGKELNTYHRVTMPDGKETMVGSDGSVAKIAKPRPRHLRVVR